MTKRLVLPRKSRALGLVVCVGLGAMVMSGSVAGAEDHAPAPCLDEPINFSCRFRWNEMVPALVVAATPPTCTEVYWPTDETCGPVSSGSGNRKRCGDPVEVNKPHWAIEYRLVIEPPNPAHSEPRQRCDRNDIVSQGPVLMTSRTVIVFPDTEDCPPPPPNCEQPM